MSDKPILFSGPMVRAMIAGTKTQTRREMKPQPKLQMNGFYHVSNSGGGRVNVAEEDVGREAVDYLRIVVGDRLWVKETSRITSWGEDGEVWMNYAADDAKSGTLHPSDEDFLERLCARVERAGAETDATGNYTNIPPGALVKPSIFMPRWASRITLTVTEVRVERLQDISVADAVAEGALASSAVDQFAQVHAIPMYRAIWTGINGDGSWDANPWVAAYTFTVAMGNIDSVGKP